MSEPTTTCSNCLESIGVDATTCPHCGKKQPTPRRYGVIAVVSLVVVLLVAAALAPVITPFGAGALALLVGGSIEYSIYQKYQEHVELIEAARREAANEADA